MNVYYTKQKPFPSCNWSCLHKLLQSDKAETVSYFYPSSKNIFKHLLVYELSLKQKRKIKSKQIKINFFNAYSSFSSTQEMYKDTYGKTPFFCVLQSTTNSLSVKSWTKKKRKRKFSCKFPNSKFSVVVLCTTCCESTYSERFCVYNTHIHWLALVNICLHSCFTPCIRNTIIVVHHPNIYSL